MDLLSGFVVGIFGSLHCAAMCGPIAMVLPVGSTSRMTFIAGRTLYNAGRIITYMVLGAVMGSIGGLISLAGMQQAISIVIGCTMFAALLIPSVTHMLGRWAFLASFASALRTRLGTLLQRRTLSSLLLIGIVNGFLPCGFLYVALAAAATLGEVARAVAFLAGFGLGTVPVMLGVSLIGRTLRPSTRRRFSALLPAFTAALAILFILRGLNLGIPYISPKVDQAALSAEPGCH